MNQCIIVFQKVPSVDEVLATVDCWSCITLEVHKVCIGKQQPADTNSTQQLTL